MNKHMLYLIESRNRTSTTDACITYLLSCFNIDIDKTADSNQYDPDTNILEQHMERDHLE